MRYPVTCGEPEKNPYTSCTSFPFQPRHRSASPNRIASLSVSPSTTSANPAEPPTNHQQKDQQCCDSFPPPRSPLPALQRRKCPTHRSARCTTTPAASRTWAGRATAWPTASRWCVGTRVYSGRARQARLRPGSQSRTGVRESAAMRAGEIRELFYSRSASVCCTG